MFSLLRLSTTVVFFFFFAGIYSKSESAEDTEVESSSLDGCNPEEHGVSSTTTGALLLACCDLFLRAEEESALSKGPIVPF